jgi:hypothetical protein
MSVPLRAARIFAISFSNFKIESFPGAGRYNWGTCTPLLYLGCVSAKTGDIRSALFGMLAGEYTAEKAATAGNKSTMERIIIEEIQDTQLSDVCPNKRKN